MQILWNCFRQLFKYAGAAGTIILHYPFCILHSKITLNLEVMK